MKVYILECSLIKSSFKTVLLFFKKTNVRLEELKLKERFKFKTNEIAQCNKNNISNTKVVKNRGDIGSKK